ncbi:MAG: hypothetical protein KF685_06940 [Acidobacteria bacterium]|nr:hypothetical protein [Acidobacteriota bacterium]
MDKKKVTMITRSTERIRIITTSVSNTLNVEEIFKILGDAHEDIADIELSGANDEGSTANNEQHQG